MTKRTKITVIIVAGALAVLALVTGFLMKNKIDSFEHEKLAEAFSVEDKYVQVTLFIPESAGFDTEDIKMFRYNLENKLTEKAIEPKNKNARLYADAYSAYADMSLESTALRTSKVKTAYVGGDYNLFHSKISSCADIVRDINHDRILLSEKAAWQLYGGYELYDFTVNDGVRDYYISGVYEENDGEVYESFYGGKPSCVTDITLYPEMPVTVYELILINPIKGFAKEVITESIGLETGTYLYVENTDRFSLGKLFGKIPKLLDYEESIPEGVYLTPEEISARRAEKELALMLLVLIILALFPGFVIIYLIYKLAKLVKKLMSKYIVEKIKYRFSYS